MAEFTNIPVFNQVITAFLEQKKQEVIALQKQQNRRASGKSASLIEVDVKSGFGQLIDNSGYLDWGSESGRKPGKMPPVSAILAWVRIKGIKPAKGSELSLAFGIAKKIAKQGTLLYRSGGKSGVLSIPLNQNDIGELRTDLGGVAETYVRDAINDMVIKANRDLR